jgi:Domain of unknown function (DUF3576)
MQLASTWRIIFGAIVIGLAGCSSTQVEAPQGYEREQSERLRQEYGTVHGGKGIFQAGTGRFKQEDGRDGAGGGIGVNAYLWRAALETIAFLPLAQADPFGGVIITDWHSPPETPAERFKLNVYILDTVLRADGLKVVVFRQTNDANGWHDAAVDPQTATKIEDNILTRARELRIAALNASS